MFPKELPVFPKDAGALDGAEKALVLLEPKDGAAEPPNAGAVELPNVVLDPPNEKLGFSVSALGACVNIVVAPNCDGFASSVFIALALVVPNEKAGLS